MQVYRQTEREIVMQTCWSQYFTPPPGAK